MARSDPELISLYEQNPVEFNSTVRHAYAAGRTHPRVIEEIERNFADYSFSDLRRPAEEVRAGVRLQEQARTLWRGNDLDGARRLLQRALRSLPASRPAERAFTLFLMAELEADSENWEKSVDLAFQAMNQSERPRRLQEALILDCLGYSFWYLDRVEEASRAFENSLERWKRFKGPGISVHAWNNLGLLFWEMGFVLRAEQVYRNGLRHLDRVHHPEVAFGLLRNLALLLHRNGRPAEARALLEEARALGPVAPVELLAAEAEIMERPDLLDSLQPRRSDLIIDFALLRGAFAGRQGRHGLAERIYREALEQNASASPAFLRRSLLPELGKALEKQGKFREAADLYLQGLREQTFRLTDSRFLPFPRLATPFLDGYIRCLVELDAPWQARSAIRERAVARSRDSRRFLQSIRKEPPSPLSFSCGPFNSDGEAPSPEKAPIILEFWPSLDETFVWVDAWNGSRFLRLATPELSSLLEGLVREFAAVQQTLPPHPPSEQLIRIYGMLIEPLLPLIADGPLQITAHGTLEQFPFEMLLSPAGRWMFEDHVLAYWPTSEPAPSRTAPRLGPPSAAFSASILAKESGRMERRALRRIFPRLREEFPWGSDGSAHFHHLAAHLVPGTPFWIHSSLEDGIRLPDLFRRSYHCNLLSLAACDLANSELLVTPFWMGAAELFVHNGARSLLISRWKLDEASIPIYLDFLRKVRSGETLGVALQEARVEFLKNGGDRRRNPFYWAGLALVGNPNMRLYPESARFPGRCSSVGLFVIVALLFWISFRIRS